MKIIVTGCAGFIGSNFVHWLLENTDHTIIGIDDFSTGYLENLPPQSDRFFYYIDSVLLRHQIDKIFNVNKPTVCFHFAAYAAEGRSNNIRSFIHTNNTVGTCNVINACVNHNCKLVFTSSVAVYSGDPPFSEITDPNPIDEYGLSKLMSEKSIQIAGQQQGLEWCIIRPRNVFGERQAIWDTSRNVSGIWMYQALHKQPMTIYGDGSNRRAFTPIESILPCLYNAIKVLNEIINLGVAGSLSILEFNDMIKEVTQWKEIVFLEERHEVKEAHCYIKKSQQLLEFDAKKANTLIFPGLEKMWSWAKIQPARKLMIPPTLEVKKTNHISIK